MEFVIWIFPQGTNPGIEGFGIGEGTVIIYLREQENAYLPPNIEGVPVEYVVTGKIKPLAESA